jgi:uncharacterized protein YjbJ (UPF0337 family)
MAFKREEGLMDKVKGRVKKAAGDLTDDSKLRKEGRKDERHGKAKEGLEDAKNRVAEEAEKVRSTR